MYSDNIQAWEWQVLLFFLEGGVINVWYIAIYK